MRSPSTGVIGSTFGRRAGGDHQALAGGHGALALGGVDHQRARVGEPAGALDRLDAAALQRGLQALPVGVDDLVLVGHDLGDVDAVERRVDAQRRAVADLLGDLRAVQERLGRDAAPVQARAADLGPLDQRHRQPEPRGAQRTRVPPGPAPEHHDVVRVSHRATSVEALAGRRDPSRAGLCPTPPATRLRDHGRGACGARRCMRRTRPPAPSSWTSRAGRCRWTTAACSPSTPRCASTPGCSTCRTWGRWS